MTTDLPTTPADLETPTATDGNPPPPKSPRRPRQPRIKPTLQELRARLPGYVPSPRNLEIYEEVTFAKRHQLEVAVMFRITRQRVAKICQRVRDWIAIWGGEDQRHSPAERLRIARHTANGSLDRLQRDVRFAISLIGHDVHNRRTRCDREGKLQWSEQLGRWEPPRSGFYAVLLRAILAQAKISGAMEQTGQESGVRGQESGDREQERSSATPQSAITNPQSSTPPFGLLPSDILSDSTCAKAPPRNGNPKRCGKRASAAPAAEADAASVQNDTQRRCCTALALAQGLVGENCDKFVARLADLDRCASQAEALAAVANAALQEDSPAAVDVAADSSMSAADSSSSEADCSPSAEDCTPSPDDSAPSAANGSSSAFQPTRLDEAYAAIAQLPADDRREAIRANYFDQLLSLQGYTVEQSRWIRDCYDPVARRFRWWRKVDEDLAWLMEPSAPEKVAAVADVE